MLANRSVRQRSRSPLGLWLLLLTLFIVPLWLSYSAPPHVALADQSNASAVLLDVPEKSRSNVQSQSEAQSEDLNPSDTSQEGSARLDEGLPAAVPVRYDGSKPLDAQEASEASSATRQGSDVYCVFLPLLTGGSGATTTQSHSVAVPELVEGGAGVNCITSDQPIEVATIVRSSPSNGEDGVAVTRETIIEFSDPIDPDSVSEAVISAQFGGQTLATRLHVSPDNRTVTLFYNEPLPASARVRVTIDGEQLLDADGNPVDVDGDGSAGGTTTIDFDTLSLTVIEGTSVCGRVFASELDTSDRGTSVNVPLQGVTITVDGMEDTLRTTTDNKGNFCLDPAPAGRFFVHIDGRTATNGVPEGTYYPFVGKAWESTIGQETNVGTAHLPLVPEGTLQPVSQTEETTINLAPSVLEQFPEFADVSITVPANSLFSDNGTRGGSVGIAPVPPDRLPGQLPEELNFPVVITVQTDGATNFDTPAPVCFPNLPDPDTGETLAAGEKSALFSFNHDIGRWEIAGSMTVNEDGTLICADEGVGIRAPGWHGSQPGSNGEDGGGGDNDCPECDARPVYGKMVECSVNLTLDVVGLLPVMGCAYSIGRAVGDIATGCIYNVGDICSVAGVAIKGFVTGIACIPTIGTIFSAGKAVRNITKCVDDLDAHVNDYVSCKEGRSLAGFTILGDNLYAEQAALFDAWHAYIDAVMGSAKWRNVDPADEAILNEFYSQLNESMAEESVEGLLISASERSGLLALPLPTGILVADAEALLTRMNRLTNNELPNELNAIYEAAQQLEDIAVELENRGWTTTLDGLTRGYEVIDAEIVHDAEPIPLYYLVTNLDTDLQQRGRLENGIFNNLILAANTFYQIDYVDPSSLQTTSVRFISASNGDVTKIPTGLFVSPDPIDSDNDNFPDQLEIIVGTNANNPDTDDDGIDDGAEVQQGTNPLDGLAVATGIIGTVNTPGTALDVCALNDIAAVADSEAGVSVFNVFNGMNPSIIAQVDTPGNAQAVACAGDLIAVADGEAGLAIIDISDPPAARVIHQIDSSGNAQTVAAGGNLAYVGTSDGNVAVVELSSGAGLYGVEFSEAVHDVALSGDELYVLTASSLFIYQTSSGGLQELASLPVSGSAAPLEVGRKLFVGGNLAYVGYFRGYSVIDVSDPTTPQLIGSPPETQAAMHDIVANGSGLVLGTTSFAGVSTLAVSLYDSSDPTDVTQFITSFDTPGAPRALAIYNGLAYVADQAGMQVINYLAYDSQGVPPTIALTNNLPSNQVPEGGLVRVTADVSDDVQVRQVEFYLDGKRIATDGTFPFEYRFSAPSLSTQSSFTLMARAKDTGGNTTESNLLTVNVIPDSEPPTVAILEPAAGERFTLLDSGIPVTVNATDNVRVAGLSFKVDGTPVSANRVSLNTYELAMPATIGTYQISVVATDGAGLSAESTPVSVEVIDLKIGDQLSAKIDFAGDLDRYVFSAEAGQVVFFDSQSEDNSNWRWQLVDSEGTSIFNRSLSSDPGTHTLELGGTYTMIIGNQNSDETGAYQLQLLQVPPAQTFSIAIGDVVSDGVPASGAGNIESPGALDIYTFEATAGQNVFFDLQSEGNSNWGWKLVDSAGTSIFERTLSSDPGTHTLELGGTYTMIIGNQSRDATGTYQLQLWDASPDQFSIAIGDVVSDGVPQAGAGNIETPGKLDIYTFSATAGQEVFFDLQSEANSNWQWQLVDSAGTVIFNQNLSNDPGTHILELGGTYTMSIGNQSRDETGTYQFQLRNTGQSNTFQINIGDVVSDGVPAPGAGNIEEPGSLDTYTFEATAGQVVYFDLQEGFNDDWRWILEDSQGTVIFNQRFRNDPESYELTLGGTYTMTIGNQNSDHTGTYQIQLLAFRQR